MSPYRTASVVAVPVALFVLLASAPGIGAARAAPPTTASELPAGTSQWAYGANYTATGTWTNSSGGYSASLTAYYGWQTILTQTNQSSSSFTLQIQRTTAVDYWLTFCKPGCSNPTWTGNMTFKAWESEVGFANLTTNGSVTENGVSVPALALENESNHIHGNVTEAVNAAYHGILIVHTASYYFSVNASSNVSLEFTPALGLVPNTLTTGAAWNSTSGFVGSGGWSAAYDYVHVPIAGTTIHVAGPISGQVSGSGNVALEGVDDGSVTLKNGVSTTAVALAIAGPFHIYEGFLLLPSQSDLLGAGANAWSSYQNDSAATATATTDFGSRGAHLGLLASATSYSPQPTSQSTLVDSSPLPATASGPSPAAMPGGGSTPGGAVVQGQPESVPSSMNQTHCLIAGNCANPGGAGIPAMKHSGLVAVLVIGLLVGTLVALAVVVGRRRSVPPPPSPNARLYPPVSASSAPPRVGKAPAGSPDEAEDDPLGHLW
jgi:hypothetical protein